MDRIWLGRRPFRDWLIICVIAIAVSRQWLNDSIPSGDFAGFYVWSWYLKESLLRFHAMQDWSPYWLAGATFYQLFPFLGLWVILPAVAAGSILGTKLIAVALLAASGVTMYLLAYHLTRSRNGALLAGIAYIVFPYHILVTAVYFHLDQIMAYAWVPIVLLLVLRGVEEGRWLHIALAGIALGLLPLMNIEYSVTLFPLAAILSLFLLMSPWLQKPPSSGHTPPDLLRAMGNRAVRLLGIGAIALAASAWWLFPSIASASAHYLLPEDYARPFIWVRYAMLVDRGGTTLGAMMPDWVVNPASGAVHPVAAMYNGAFYLGLVLVSMWLLACINLLTDKATPGRNKQYFVMLSVTLVVGTYLALGTNSRLLAPVFPLINNTRSPFRFLFLSSLALPLLAAFFYVWAERKVAMVTFAPRWASAALCIVLVVAVLVDFYPYQSFFSHRYTDSFVAELQRAYGFAGQDQVDYRIANPKDYDPIYNMGVIYSGKPILGAWVWWTSTMQFGDFYVRKVLPSVTDMADPEKLALLLGQANVKYLVLDTPPRATLNGPFTPVYSSGGFQVFLNNRWRPFVETVPPSSPTWQRPAPGKLAVHVDLRESSMLVVRESYSRRWRAYVDGREAETTVVDSAFVGVPLGPGAHQVLLQYEESGFALLGKAVTGSLGVGLILVSLRRRPGGKKPSKPVSLWPWAGRPV